MLAAAGGGGGGTDWSSMTVPMMQALIQNPKTDQYYQLLTGWEQSYQLIADHMSQVQGYRDSLASVWPPAKSAASATYLARLDDLLKSLNETYEAALANHDAFAAATLSIGLAQPEMQKIYDEYASNQQLLDTFNATKSQQSSSGASPSPTPSPSPSGEEPPVAPGRQEALQQKAATLMSSVSSDLIQAQVQIVTPTSYVAGIGLDDKTTPNSGSTYAAPPIPPITPTPVAIGSTASNSTRPSVTFPSSGRSASPVPTLPNASQPGLVLGGTTVPVSTPPTGIGPIPTTLPPGASGPFSSPGVLPPLPGGALPPPSTGVGRVGLPNENIIRPGSRFSEGMRAMPPGGVIGGTKGGGLDQPGAARAGARRINPVGGVIGERGQGTATSGRGAGRGMGARGSLSEQPFAQAGNRRGGRRDQSDGTYWDPNNPWDTEEGVDPVVLPPNEQRIDPGPAIGLS